MKPRIFYFLFSLPTPHPSHLTPLTSHMAHTPSRTLTHTPLQAKHVSTYPLCTTCRRVFFTEAHLNEHTEKFIAHRKKKRAQAEEEAEEEEEEDFDLCRPPGREEANRLFCAYCYLDCQQAPHFDEQLLQHPKRPRKKHFKVTRKNGSGYYTEIPSFTTEKRLCEHWRTSYPCQFWAPEGTYETCPRCEQRYRRTALVKHMKRCERIEATKLKRQEKRKKEHEQKRDERFYQRKQMKQRAPIHKGHANRLTRQNRRISNANLMRGTSKGIPPNRRVKAVPLEDGPPSPVV